MCPGREAIAMSKEVTTVLGPDLSQDLPSPPRLLDALCVRHDQLVVALLGYRGYMSKDGTPCTSLTFALGYPVYPGQSTAEYGYSAVVTQTARVSADAIHSALLSVGCDLTQFPAVLPNPLVRTVQFGRDTRLQLSAVGPLAL